jgi:hypothetical protein
MQSKASSVAEDREALLARMRQRRYPETLPVLAYHWLKTLRESGYGRRQWKKLSRLLRRTIGEQLADSPSHKALVSIQTRIQQTIFSRRQSSRPKVPRSEHICGTLSSDLLAPYVRRLLNEWLPAEAARLLVNGNGSTPPPDGGIPALVDCPSH